MILQYYGLREQPFGVTPNPRYLYHSAIHREALASLIYGVEADLGFAALIADPGMGKTTLLFYLLEKFRDNARTALIFNTLCTPSELLKYLANELEIATHDNDPVSLNERIKDVLVQEARARRRVIVVIDEAQNLDESVLETVRLLSDLETQNSKLLHIILAGQLQLAEKLARPSMAQLLQRITMLNRLKPLTPEETRNYIDFRLAVAGYKGTPLFAPEAIDRVATLSGGIPRNINRICSNALSEGCALEVQSIGPDIIEEVANDLDIADLLQQKAAQSHSVRPSLVDVAELGEDAKQVSAAPRPVVPPPKFVAQATMESGVAAAASQPAQIKYDGQLAIAADQQVSEGGPTLATPCEPPAATRTIAAAMDKPVAAETPLATLVGVERKTISSRTVVAFVVCVLLMATGLAGWTLWWGHIGRVSASVQADPARHTNVSRGVEVPIPEGTGNQGGAPEGKKSERKQAPVGAASPSSLAPKMSSRRSVETALHDESPVPETSGGSSEPEPGSPVLIRKVQPVYPVAAQRSGIQGSVTVAALIGTDGRPRDVRTLNGNPILARAAMDAVSQWVYQPYSLNGRPVEVETEVVVDFALH